MVHSFTNHQVCIIISVHCFNGFRCKSISEILVFWNVLNFCWFDNIRRLFFFWWITKQLLINYRMNCDFFPFSVDGTKNPVRFRLKVIFCGCIAINDWMYFLFFSFLEAQQDRQTERCWCTYKKFTSRSMANDMDCSGVKNEWQQ